MNMGEKIRELRIRKKMTQSDVVGGYMTRNMLSKIENGSAAPSLRTLEHIAGALEVPVGYFVDDLPDGTACRGSVGGVSAVLADVKKIVQAVVDDGETQQILSGCIQARLLLGGGEAGQAKATLLKCECLCEKGAEKQMVYSMLEECCEALEDYKGAYEYVKKRMSL